MPKFSVDDIEEGTGTGYPAALADVVRERYFRRLAGPAGLTQFGVNLVRLAPGAWSSQRHWHTREDEFVYMMEGEAVLVTDDGEAVMRPGDCAGFPAGEPNAHTLQNRSQADCVFLVVGSRSDADEAHYPDVDLQALPGRYSGTGGFTRKDGTPY
jgi:uncharacterized cupin superfamily protein